MDTPTKGFKWDAEAERDLFGACLVVLGQPKGSTLADAHKLLQDTRGITYTVKAATHRMSDPDPLLELPSGISSIFSLRFPQSSLTF